GGTGGCGGRRSPGSPPTWRSPAPPGWWTRPRSGWTGSTRPAGAGWPRTRSRCRSRSWRRSRRSAQADLCPKGLTPPERTVHRSMTDTTAATPFLAAAAAAADLEDWGPLAEATGEPMQTTGRTLWADGDQEVGVWECSPGHA